MGPVRFFSSNLPDGGIGCCVTLRIGPALANLACWPMPILACIIWAWAAALYSGGGGLTLPIPPAICCCCCITCKNGNAKSQKKVKNYIQNDLTETGRSELNWTFERFRNIALLISSRETKENTFAFLANSPRIGERLRKLFLSLRIGKIAMYRARF